MGALLVAAGAYCIVSHFPKLKQQEAIPQGNNNPEGNILQPNLGADAHQNIAELNQHVAEHFAENNIQQLPAAEQNQIIQNPLENVGIQHLPAQVQVDVHPNPQPQVQQGMQAIEEHPNDGFIVFNPGVENEEPQLKIEEDIIDIDDNPAEVIVNANPLPLQEVYRIGSEVNEHVGFESPEEPVQAEDPDRVAEEAQASNQTQTLNQINNPISPHSLIGMPNFNKPKTMLALEYHPKTPIDIVIPDQVVNFLNQQPVNHPWLPNNSVFSEPFIQYYEKTFKQKPILMLTYDPKQVPQPETPAWKARDPLLDEALFAIYGGQKRSIFPL